MTKKTLGYTELQWTCPNCGAINPGPEETCTQCGAPQPENVVFEQVKGAELIQDEKIKARVEAGADIHCPYCGARNLGDAKACTQCGGDLVGGERREGGKVLGAYQKETVSKVPCPHCGAENLETSKTCSKCGGSMQREIAEEKIEKPAAIPSTPAKKKAIPIALIILLAVVCIGAVLLIFLSMKTEAVTGTVVQVGWERSIAIEGIVPVDYRDWQDSIPADGEILRCEQEVRSIENEPKPNAEEVCGTPYSVDTGSGYAEVVQDCQYYIYDDFCTYTVLEWAVVDTVSQTGDNFSAVWPEPVISADQRLGVQTESYLVYFDTENGEVRYNISDFQTFQEFQPGTQWNLEINSFGGIVSVSP